METVRKQRPPEEERLLEGLQQLEEWARGKRDDLRVTTVTLPDESELKPPEQPVLLHRK